MTWARHSSPDRVGTPGAVAGSRLPRPRTRGSSRLLPVSARHSSRRMTATSSWPCCARPDGLRPERQLPRPGRRGDRDGTPAPVQRALGWLSRRFPHLASLRRVSSWAMSARWWAARTLSFFPFRTGEMMSRSPSVLMSSSVSRSMSSNSRIGFSMTKPGDIRETEELPTPLPRERHGPLAG